MTDKYFWQMSESNERYTPANIVDLARQTFLGGIIDLDPASNPLANTWINARRFYTENNSGLDASWFGRVWCNPPYGKEQGTNRSNVDIWADKAHHELLSGHTGEIAFLIGAHHLALSGVQALVNNSVVPVVVLFFAKRIRFLRIPGNKIGEARDLDDLEIMTRPSFNSAMIYAGPNAGRFIALSAPFGLSMVHNNMVLHESPQAAAVRNQWSATPKPETGSATWSQMRIDAL